VHLERGVYAVISVAGFTLDVWIAWLLTIPKLLLLWLGCKET